MLYKNSLWLSLIIISSFCWTYYTKNTGTYNYQWVKRLKQETIKLKLQFKWQFARKFVSKITDVLTTVVKTHGRTHWHNYMVTVVSVVLPVEVIVTVAVCLLCMRMCIRHSCFQRLHRCCVATALRRCTSSMPIHSGFSHTCSIHWQMLRLLLLVEATAMTRDELRPAARSAEYSHLTRPVNKCCRSTCLASTSHCTTHSTIR